MRKSVLAVLVFVAGMLFMPLVLADALTANGTAYNITLDGINSTNARISVNGASGLLAARTAPYAAQSSDKISGIYVILKSINYVSAGVSTANVFIGFDGILNSNSPLPFSINGAAHSIAGIFFQDSNVTVNVDGAGAATAIDQTTAQEINSSSTGRSSTVGLYIISTDSDNATNSSKLIVFYEAGMTILGNGVLTEVNATNETVTNATNGTTVNCTDECVFSECVDTGSYRACADADNDSCLEWQNATACGIGELCSGGTCILQRALNEPIEPVVSVDSCTGSGIVSGGKFCDPNSMTWLIQMENGMGCAQDYECFNGNCASSVCAGKSMLWLWIAIGAVVLVAAALLYLKFGRKNDVYLSVSPPDESLAMPLRSAARAPPFPRPMERYSARPAVRPYLPIVAPAVPIVEPVAAPTAPESEPVAAESELVEPAEPVAAEETPALAEPTVAEPASSDAPKDNGYAAEA